MHPLFQDEKKLIGGMFGLHVDKDEKSHRPVFINEESIYMVNARSCIWFLLGHLKPRKVWCPSYLCRTIIEAIRTANVQPDFYEVDFNLRINSPNWIDCINEDDIVLFINYFGFSSEFRFFEQVKNQGAWILEDASQSLLTTRTYPFADFTIYSPRKFIGIPDGGIINIHSDIKLNDQEYKSIPPVWWQKALSASVLRREFDKCGGMRDWFAIFQEIEPGAPIGPFSMSELSKFILENNIDYTSIAQKRRENYQYLLDNLKHIALFPSLPNDIVPLGFPVYLKERDKFRQVLFDHNIYPPVHWKLLDLVPLQFGESHKLASEIMTLPCDQRYDLQDMDRMAQILFDAY